MALDGDLLLGEDLVGDVAVDLLVACRLRVVILLKSDVSYPSLKTPLALIGGIPLPTDNYEKNISFSWIVAFWK